MSVVPFEPAVWFWIVSIMVGTLNKLSKLRETKYGQPPPRHGLNLLWWFAHACVQIDSNDQMIAKCNPANGAFGFHRFYNWDYLLPKINLPYYEVGNLNTPDSLPYYVIEYHSGHSDNSNKDRIIVSYNSRQRRFMNVYVTQHSDQKHFDQNHTYRISLDLLKDIQELSREDFLSGRTNRPEHISINIPQPLPTNTRQSIRNEFKQDIRDSSREDSHRGRTNRPEDISISMPQSEQHSQTHTCTGWKCCCAMICCGLMVLLIAAAAIYIWLNKK